MQDAQELPFKAEVAEVLRLVVTSLYSHKEIFLRELISNASDALDKLRFEALQNQDLLGSGEPLAIRLSVDKTAGILTISDNGIGMTSDELAQNLGTIARSGTREFARRLKEASQGEQAGLIGQFGVGFYSAYLVADRVEVISRAAGSDTAHKWSSDARDTFTLEPAERASQGTSVILHLKPEEREFLELPRLRSLIQRYSDFIGYPIEIPKHDDDKKEPELERANRANALWQRSPKDVDDAQYVEFYKHLTHDWQDPLARRHFKIEGTQEFAGILFLPRHPTFELFDPKAQHGVRLHVKRVFVMDNCEDLLPRWLRFVRGVIDSEDLPLNVSREILQDSSLVRTIRKQVIQHALSMIEELAKDAPEDYATFWREFGVVLKEGLHFEAEHRDRIAKLIRWESTAGSGWVSLDEYVDRMKDGQPAIYYAAGTSRSVVASSPHLEALKHRGFEVFLMTDAVDPFAVSALETYREKPFVSAMNADLDLGDGGASSEDDESSPDDKREPDDPRVGALFTRFREVLAERVEDVRASDRLRDSPACLVTPVGGLQPHIERLLRAQKVDVPASKRILEINAGHPVIASIGALLERDPTSPKVSEWIEVVYDQALISEGSPIDDPGAFATRLTGLLRDAASAALGKS